MAGVSSEPDAEWETVVDYVLLRQDSETPEMFAAAKLLWQSELLDIMEEFSIEQLSYDIRHTVRPAVVDNIRAVTAASGPRCGSALPTIVNYMYESLRKHLESIGRLERVRRACSSVESAKLRRAFQQLCRSLLCYRMPDEFYASVDAFYEESLKVYHDRFEEEIGEDASGTSQCEKCDGFHDTGSCESNAAILLQLEVTNNQLYEMGLLDAVAGDGLERLAHARIDAHVTTTCQLGYDCRQLERLEWWLQNTVIVWLQKVGSCRSAGSPSLVVSNQMAGEPKNWSPTDGQQLRHERLKYYMYDVYVRTRIAELFDIIVEYPDSRPALEDLSLGLEKTNLRSELTQSLQRALENRLLHPGVNTTDIITAYISAIKALKIVDPSGVILEIVCQPVTRYLRSRDDTVRCIVSNLTDDGCGELSEELAKGQAAVTNESSQDAGDDTAALGDDWESWLPDPVDANPETTSKSRRSSDVIGMLINIYGSKELFIHAYWNLLADRLLSTYSYNTAREIRYLELLKIRFGDLELHKCEVMLKDVSDSKRINTRIHEEREKQADAPTTAACIPVNGMILSAQFWPPFREEKLELPEVMSTSLAAYRKSFEALKGNRTLNWKPHLGLVNMEIELKSGRVLSFTASPVHTAIIMLFQDKERWSIDELSAALRMSSTALRRKVAFWQSNGLLREESPDVYVLVEDELTPSSASTAAGGRLSAAAEQRVIVAVEDDDVELATASAEAQRQDELQVFWSYVVGMLTNLGSLPIERIHTMLKMFAMQGNTGKECTQQELKRFLDGKVKEERLVYSAGVYRLPSK